MKKFVLFFLCSVFIISILNGFFIFRISNLNFDHILAEEGEEIAQTTEEKQSVEVQHFFTHELIYSPEKAFSTKNSLRNSFDRDHLTCTEFKNILNALYENNFVLVDLYDVYEEKDGKLVVKEGLNFEGKKPFVLSFDDMTYDTKNRGIVEKIVVRNGKLYDFASVEEEQYTQERDCLTILEDFIEKHPDFSFNNARATLCVTGYNGMFGYRVFSDTYLSGEELEREEESLKNLITFLKEKGYRFASHSYGHINTLFSSYETFCKDVEKWKNEIGSYVGETEIYCYPGGAHKCGTSNNEFLKSNGFKVFLCTGNMMTTSEMEDQATYLYRHPLDGKSLRNCEVEYENFFNTKDVYDPERQVSFNFKENY